MHMHTRAPPGGREPCIYFTPTLLRSISPPCMRRVKCATFTRERGISFKLPHKSQLLPFSIKWTWCWPVKWSLCLCATSGICFGDTQGKHLFVIRVTKVWSKLVLFKTIVRQCLTLKKCFCRRFFWRLAATKATIEFLTVLWIQSPFKGHNKHWSLIK